MARAWTRSPPAALSARSLTTIPTLTSVFPQLCWFRYLCRVQAPHFSSKSLLLCSNCSCLRLAPNKSNEADNSWWTNTVLGHCDLEPGLRDPTTVVVVFKEP